MGKRVHRFHPIVFLLILLLSLAMVFSAAMLIDGMLGGGQVSDGPSASKTITVDGVEYFPRQDITVMMLLGIDEAGPVKDSGSYNNTGEADVVSLAVFDEKAKSYTVLMLNRDTMLDIPVLGIGGKPAGTRYGQLALSHTYGSGLKDSCENTRAAVSDFLYGLEIDYYLAMNMDAIALLNDAVGGVQVSVTDDFSAIDSTIPMGEVRLTGEQALSFIRTRQGLGDQLNLSRMKRQETYMEGFFTALNGSLDGSDSFVLETYDTLSPYLVSDCPAKTLNSFANRYAEYTFEEIISPAGENRVGSEYMEFYVDEMALQELVLQLFYARK